MPALTITTTTADASRVLAVAQAAGYPDVKSWLVAYAKSQVQQYEQNQATQSYASTYTPIAPS